MTKELFVEVFNHFLKFMNASKSNSALLVMDNHRSHLLVALVNAARDHGVTILTFSPNCSHRLQPLDVSVYGPFKSCYNSACQSWMLSNPGCPLTTYNLASLSASSFYRAFTPSNIAAGFKKTGIYPFDDHIFSDDMFLPSLVSDQAVPQQEVDEPNDANLPAPITHDTDDVAGTSGTDVTPETVRPYPKVVPREKYINRKRMKSAIITDSPVISKEKSINRPVGRKAKSAKRMLISTSSSESEAESYCTSSSDVESSSDFSDLSADDQSTLCEPKQGNFVLVVYKGKRKVHFVGEVIEEKDEEGDIEVKFLRKHTKVPNGFVEPDVEDIHSVSVGSVVLILPQPSTSGSTRRATAIKKFATDFSSYEM